MSNVPGHIRAVQLLYALMMVGIGLLVAVLAGSYFWACGASTPAGCAKHHGYSSYSDLKAQGKAK